jgi:hypothetical protein
MTATNPGRCAFLVPLALLALAGAGCKPGAHGELPAEPETAAPAPPAAIASQEDRGRKPGDESAATPQAEQDAFNRVEDGEAERAASKRGHDSAGEAPPAAQPPGGQ